MESYLSYVVLQILMNVDDFVNKELCGFANNECRWFLYCMYYTWGKCYLLAFADLHLQRKTLLKTLPKLFKTHQKKTPHDSFKDRWLHQLIRHRYTYKPLQWWCHRKSPCPKTRNRYHPYCICPGLYRSPQPSPGRHHHHPWCGNRRNRCRRSTRSRTCGMCLRIDSPSRLRRNCHRDCRSRALGPYEGRRWARRSWSHRRGWCLCWWHRCRELGRR